MLGHQHSHHTKSLNQLATVWLIAVLDPSPLMPGQHHSGIVPGEILSVIGVVEGWLVGWQCYEIMYLVKSRNSRMKENQLSTTDSGAQYIQMVLVILYV